MEGAHLRHAGQCTGSQTHSGSLGAPATGFYMEACCAFLSPDAAHDQADNSLFPNLSNYSLKAHPKVGCSGLHMAESPYAREKKSARAAQAFSKRMKTVHNVVHSSLQWDLRGSRKEWRRGHATYNLCLVTSFMRLSANFTTEVSDLKFISG